MKIEEWQIVEATRTEPRWEGDLEDDCTAIWAGLILRAEEMDQNFWWWAVYDAKTNEVVDASYNREPPESPPQSAGIAREFAEKCARDYLLCMPDSSLQQILKKQQ